MRAAIILLAACGTNLTPQPEPAPVLPECLPNRDGAITAAELPVAIGVTASYYVSKNVAIAQWDLDEERASDDVIALGPAALGTQWFAPEFPAGEFYVDGGVYHQTDEALFLDGLVSETESPKTLIKYTAPVPVLRFPVADGDSFTATGAIAQGTIMGLPFNGQDELTVEVAGEGRIDLPYVRFSPTLRVRTHVIRRPSSGTPVTSRRSQLYLFECFGEVARAESVLDEPNPDFTMAASLRRFALGVKP